MLKYIVLLTSFFVFFSCGSSKNSSSIPENAPEWVSKTPLSNFNYIGIRMAPKSSSDYREKAQKMALTEISNSGKGSFLAVLKLYGRENENYLSFPIEGYSLALDFKIEKGLFELLDKLDQIVLKYNGRIYLTKDVRVSKETFEKGYPNIDKFRELRKEYGMDKKFQSLQSKRVGI